MKIESHKARLKESIEVIEDSIEKGLLKRQRNIGFNTSSASIDLLEIYLHKLNLIGPGFIIKHEWLKSTNKTKEKFYFDFPNKKIILDLIYKIEEKRNALCYGTTQSIEIIREVIYKFNKLKNIFIELGLSDLDEE